MLRFLLILLLNLSLISQIFVEGYDEDKSSEETDDNVKITDVLKMIVLPPANEMKNILSSGNNTTLRDSPRLDFILQALEYWRKHNTEDNIEEDLAEEKNATRLTFNLRDDFIDDDNSRHHLSKKAQARTNNWEQSSAQNGPSVRRSKRDGFIPLPYIYVKNLYLNDYVYKTDNGSENVKKDTQTGMR